MRILPLCCVALLLLASRVLAGEVVLVVDDADGAGGRVRAPVSAKIDLAKLLGPGVKPARLQLAELASPGQQPGEPIPVQFEPDVGAGPSTCGTLWWLMPAGEKGPRRFRLSVADDEAPLVMSIKADADRQFFDVRQGDLPVLRYNFGTVPPPAGTDPAYARGDYISPLYGPSGEVLTEDYPKDHPHHRGVSWSWPVTRWKDEVRDIWAVRGVWARPAAMHRAEAGPVLAILEAENVWKWGDKDPIVREQVLIRAFRQDAAGRFVDVEVRLAGLVDGVAIGGRPHAGYGGFGIRAAPAQQRHIALHADPPSASPRRSWLDYSGVFAGGQGRAGVAIFEHPSNPGYPSELQQYPGCNYAMPAFPGQREVPLPPGQTLVLRHRLWIHAGGADEETLADVWATYAKSEEVAVVKE